MNKLLIDNFLLISQGNSPDKFLDYIKNSNQKNEIYYEILNIFLTHDNFNLKITILWFILNQYKHYTENKIDSMDITSSLKNSYLKLYWNYNNDIIISLWNKIYFIIIKVEFPYKWDNLLNLILQDDLLNIDNLLSKTNLIKLIFKKYQNEFVIIDNLMNNLYPFLELISVRKFHIIDNKIMIIIYNILKIFYYSINKENFNYFYDQDKINLWYNIFKTGIDLNLNDTKIVFKIKKILSMIIFKLLNLEVYNFNTILIMYFDIFFKNFEFYKFNNQLLFYNIRILKIYWKIDNQSEIYFNYFNIIVNYLFNILFLSDYEQNFILESPVEYLYNEYSNIDQTLKIKNISFDIIYNYCRIDINNFKNLFEYLINSIEKNNNNVYYSELALNIFERLFKIINNNSFIMSNINNFLDIIIIYNFENNIFYEFRLISFLGYLDLTNLSEDKIDILLNLYLKAINQPTLVLKSFRFLENLCNNNFAINKLNNNSQLIFNNLINLLDCNLHYDILNNYENIIKKVSVDSNLIRILVNKLIDKLFFNILNLDDDENELFFQLRESENIILLLTEIIKINSTVFFDFKLNLIELFFIFLNNYKIKELLEYLIVLLSYLYFYLQKIEENDLVIFFIIIQILKEEKLTEDLIFYYNDRQVIISKDNEYFYSNIMEIENILPILCDFIQNDLSIYLENNYILMNNYLNNIIIDFIVSFIKINLENDRDIELMCIFKFIGLIVENCFNFIKKNIKTILKIIYNILFLNRRSKGLKIIIYEVFSKMLFINNSFILTSFEINKNKLSMISGFMESLNYLGDLTSMNIFILGVIGLLKNELYEISIINLKHIFPFIFKIINKLQNNFDIDNNINNDEDSEFNEVEFFNNEIFFLYNSKYENTNSILLLKEELKKIDRHQIKNYFTFLNNEEEKFFIKFIYE